MKYPKQESVSYSVRRLSEPQINLESYQSASQLIQSYLREIKLTS